MIFPLSAHLFPPSLKASYQQYRVSLCCFSRFQFFRPTGVIMLPDVGIFITTFCKKKKKRTRPTRDTKIQLYFSTSFSLFQHKMPCVHRFPWSVHIHMDQTRTQAREGRRSVDGWYGEWNDATALMEPEHHTTEQRRESIKGTTLRHTTAFTTPRTCHPLGWTDVPDAQVCVCVISCRKTPEGAIYTKKRQAKSETASSRPR